MGLGTTFPDTLEQAHRAMRGVDGKTRIFRGVQAGSGALTRMPSATITAVAMDLGINAHMLGRWRKPVLIVHL